MTPWYLGEGSVGSVSGMGAGVADWVRFRAQPYRVIRPPLAPQGEARPAEVDTRFGNAPVADAPFSNNAVNGAGAALNIVPWTDGGIFAMQRARYEAAAQIGPFRVSLLDVFA
ncbi:MAG: hypothetical protein HY300_16990 [Verrucomicrobia bacterium]|nr:hypothetical protein [Verrucomicrobiota bacterium]